MTANQINYGKLREEARHNRETEKLGYHTAVSSRIGALAQRDQAIASQSQAQTAALRQEEDARANAAREAIDWYSALESNRHNVSAESETRRHNVETERQGAQNVSLNYERMLNEQTHWARQDTVSERNAESQYVSALGASMRGQAALLGVDVNRQLASIQALNQQEAVRHNKAQEALTRAKNAQDNLQRVADRQQDYELGMKEYWRKSYRDTQDEYVAKRNADTARIQVFTGLAGSIVRGLK